MPSKKVNGNIIGVSMQNIRLCEEIIAVNRRIGGLENKGSHTDAESLVNRRIGGLEISKTLLCISVLVNRRIGGLEKGNQRQK